MPSKKIKCKATDCREIAQRIIGHCGFCSKDFCGKHRLLEDHKCAGLEDVCSSTFEPCDSSFLTSNEERWSLGLGDILQGILNAEG